MLSAIKQLFAREPGAQALARPQLAVAQLLLEMARADFSADTRETAVVRSLLARAYALPDAEIDALIREASTQSDRAISLHETVSAINQQVSPEQKRQLLSMLWRVAYADGRLDPYEEGLLRKLADLLFVSHTDFIREKLAVIGEQGV